jgi:AraC-like DNA-binding protein
MSMPRKRRALRAAVQKSEVHYRERVLQLAQERPAEHLLYAGRGGERQSAASGSPPLSLYRHVAEGVEIALLIKGAARVLTPREAFHLTPGKLLVIDHDVYHVHLPEARGRNHLIFWCHLKQTSADLADTRYAPPDPIDFGLPGLVLTGRTDVQSIGAAIAAELASHDWGYRQAALDLLSYLSCILVRRLLEGRATLRKRQESPAISGDPATCQTIHAALDFCEANFHRKVTRTEIARAVGYSPKHLGHLVTKNLGYSISDHLRNLRAAEAKHLLETSRLSIREIAQAVGYDDPTHFTRAFKRATDLSPQAYRRRLSAL